MEKKVGIFGGTFNPIHFGHLRTTLEVYEHFALDKVLFIPSYTPPHKMTGDVAAPEIRLEMIRKAVDDFPGFEVSDVEIMRKDVSYSLDTIKALRAESKDIRIFFILGSDAFCELNTWKDYEELIFLCDFIVMTRPGFETENIKKVLPPDICKRFRYDEKNNVYESDAGTSIFFHEVTKLDISSTTIRKLLKEGKSIKHLLPESVEKYILKSGLYS
jgi:nicotinate-nucleotide adenylyltransferase